MRLGPMKLLEEIIGKTIKDIGQEHEFTGFQ